MHLLWTHLPLAERLAGIQPQVLRVLLRWPAGDQCSVSGRSCGTGRSKLRATSWRRLVGRLRLGLFGPNFADSDYDKSARVAFLHQVGIDPGRLERLLDFGCAWGYSVHQYRAAGFNTVGFEIDQARAAFGRQHLSVDLRSDWRAFADDERYDVLLTDHSLEHLPRPGVALEQFSRLAGERARLVIFVPNCGGLAARRLGTKWGPFIGEAHPIAFTSRWFAQNLPRHGFAPVFYTSHGHPLIGDDYLTDQDDIALVATRVPSRAG